MSEGIVQICLDYVLIYEILLMIKICGFQTAKNPKKAENGKIASSTKSGLWHIRGRMQIMMPFLIVGINMTYTDTGYTIYLSLIHISEPTRPY